jgi:TolB protein
MPTSKPLTLAVSFLALLVPAGGASPQETPPQGTTLETGISETGVRRIPIAIPSLDASGASAPSATEITAALRSDLEASGYFLLVPPEHYRLVKPDATGTIPYQGWQSIGAEALVLGSVTPEQDRFLVEARLFETEGHRQILGRRYRGDAETARLIAHRLADEIILHFTGERGISQSKIAFVALEGAAKEVFLMDYDGARARRLTRNGSLNLSPTWSPDGERIALTSFKDGSPSVYILDRDGGARRISLPESPLNIAPDWSPDGKQIAYSASLSGNTDLYTLRLQGGGAQRLTAGRAIDCCPTWSPTGRELAFTSDRDGTLQIYVMDAEGANVRRLTYDGNRNDSAAWSPRGDQIAYVSRIEGKYHLHVLEIATRAVRRLTFGPFNNESPTWSPDGRQLAFASDRTGTYEIYRISASGGEAVRLTRTRGAFAPAWSR